MMTKSITLLALLVSFANADDMGTVQVALTQRITQNKTARQATPAACEVTIYEHFAESDRPEYTGNTKTFQGFGSFSLTGWNYGISSVKVSGEGCVAYGHKTDDCSGDKGKGIGASVQVDGQQMGVVSTSTNMEKYWCNDCVKCVRVEQEYMPAPNTYCPNGEDLTNEQECTDSAKALGKTFDKAFDDENDFRYCLMRTFPDSGEQKVYFNTNAGAGASATPPTPPRDPPYSAICKKAAPTKQSEDYTMTGYNQYCPDGEDLTSDTKCQSAAEALGLPYGSAWDGEGDHRYCLFSNDDRQKVYFNTAGADAAAKPKSQAYASICKKAEAKTTTTTTKAKTTTTTTKAKTTTTTTKAPKEVPKCDGCSGKTLECTGICSNEKGGYCAACNSKEGTPGACCMVDASNGVKQHAADDDDTCKSIPLQHFDYTGYHMCVLTRTNAQEFPKCTGCGDRDMECWEVCNGMGPCAACDSAQGTKGACCRVNTDADGGDYVQNSPPECTGVPKSAYAFKGYHMCVLQTEVPQCPGCGARQLECWTPCGGSGYCDACNALTPQADQRTPWLKGSKGACCRMDLTDAGPQMITGAADDPCKQVPVSSFPYYGYHLCVLAPPADAK